MLTLNRLAPRQRAEMIAYVTGGKALPREISTQIVERTDGVPLFIEELTKSVVESGLVKDAGDSYVGTGPAARLAIPTTLHASLLARLDRLAPTREVAQIGAALGRSFSHELISAVAAMRRALEIGILAGFAPLKISATTRAQSRPALAVSGPKLITHGTARAGGWLQKHVQKA
jgi:predicted ATPase